MNQSNRFNRFLRHPMVIAIVTAGLFGIIVAWCGAKFQHRNWKVEHEIAKKTTFVDNLFDKRTDLGQKIFYLISKREKNCWNIFHTTKDMFY